MIRGIDHINIVVADLERSVQFYTGLLGFRKTHDVFMEGAWIEEIVRLKGVKGKVAFVEPPGGGLRIELLEYVAPAGVTLPENARANTLGLRILRFAWITSPRWRPSSARRALRCSAIPFSCPKAL